MEYQRNGTGRPRRKVNGHDDNVFGLPESKTDVSYNDGITGLGFKLFACTIAGVVFGIVVEKGRVFEPVMIREQMLFTKFVLCKTFVGALTASLVSLSLLSMLPFTSNQFMRARLQFVATLRNKGVMSSIVGGSIMGAGMTFCGSCPGVVLSQLGAGVENAGITLLGCFVGALLYGLVESVMMKITKPSKPYKVYMMDQSTPTPYFMLAMPFASMLGVVLFAMEHFAPWTSDLVVPNESTGSWFTIRSWPPILSGLTIGMLQIPIVLAVQDTVGGSSGYCTVVSQVLATRQLQKLSPYLSKYRLGLTNWWQVLFACGAIFGAWFSSTSSSSFGTVPGVSITTAFLGGVLLLFGARLASGCTSGHGVSGMGMLSLLSFAAAPSMFVGAIATAHVLRMLAVM